MTVNDERQLRVLAVLHYFYGWLVALGALITLMLVVGKIGLGPELVTDEGALGGFIIASLVGFLLIALLAAATIVAGKRLECHTHRVYCVIVAAINLLSVPPGTALGIRLRRVADWFRGSAAGRPLASRTQQFSCYGSS